MQLSEKSIASSDSQLLCYMFSKSIAVLNDDRIILKN